MSRIRFLELIAASFGVFLAAGCEKSDSSTGSPSSPAVQTQADTPSKPAAVGDAMVFTDGDGNVVGTSHVEDGKVRHD